MTEIYPGKNIEGRWVKPLLPGKESLLIILDCLLFLHKLDTLYLLLFSV